MAIINYIGKMTKTFDISSHSHEHWEIIYCTLGDGVIVFEDKSELPYQCGEMVIIPPHSIHRNTSQNGFKNIHMTIVNWTPPFFKPVKVNDNNNRNLLGILNNCYYYFHQEVHNKSNIILSFTELILNLIISYIGKDHNSVYIDIVINNIIENFSDCNYVIDNAYQDIPLSKDYLRKMFIKEKGISPLNFLTATRIAFAEKLLLSKTTNDYKIYEVSELCGFNDPLYFSRVFKKVTGKSPKEYHTIPVVKNYNK